MGRPGLLPELGSQIYILESPGLTVWLPFGALACTGVLYTWVPGWILAFTSVKYASYTTACRHCPDVVVKLWKMDRSLPANFQTMPNCWDSPLGNVWTELQLASHFTCSSTDWYDLPHHINKLSAFNCNQLYSMSFQIWRVYLCTVYGSAVNSFYLQNRWGSMPCLYHVAMINMFCNPSSCKAP